MDSNRRFINYRKLWTLDKSERKPCLHDIRQLLNDTDITTLYHILINIGTNDIEKSPNQVQEEIIEIIDILKNKYPGIKIVMCEITPR